MTIEIYNGAHTVDFKEKSHRYYVDKQLKRGVTTTISKVVAKSGLMLWPMYEALKLLETRLPVITLKDLKDAEQAHIKRRDSGADVGTEAHAMVEDFLKNGTKQNVGSREAINVITGFVEWFERVKSEVIATEQIVYSEDMDYAGTFDSILRIDGKNILCDLKTTNASREAPEGIYAENFIQLGAYHDAYDEQRVYEIEHGGTNLVPIDDLMIISCKKTGQVHTKMASELGLSVGDCGEMWDQVYSLEESLRNIKTKLGGNNANFKRSN